jgi:hypothetical protein
MDTVEFTKEELAELKPSKNALTHDADLGTYTYDTKVVGKYNTKYLFVNDTTNDTINIVFKNLRAVYINDEPMLQKLETADRYKLVESFEVVRKDPEPADADKRYPMYAFEGFKTFQKEAEVLSRKGISPTQDMYDALYKTNVAQAYSNSFYRKLHVKSPLLVAVSNSSNNNNENPF